jgi:tRNA threonylcarbamoyl adenosine modification protein YeaZ
VSDSLSILALDTAYGEISACILSADETHLSAPAKNQGNKTRSTMIIPVLDNLLGQAGLSWADLDVLAFGCGPGSFTGLRIAAATLAGINAGLKLPILHISSLAITAQQADSPDPIRVVEDARAGEAFVGYYHGGKSTQDDVCLTWEEVTALPAAGFVCLNEVPQALPEWQQWPLQLERSEALARTVRTAMGNTANWSALPHFPSPVYLQISQAERNAHG